jgi:hypothetical protein
LRAPPLHCASLLWHTRRQAAGGLKNDFECDDIVLNSQKIGALLA